MLCRNNHSSPPVCIFCISHLVQPVLDVVFNISTCSLPRPTASYAVAWPIEQTTIVCCQQTGFSLGVLDKMEFGV